MERTIGRRRDEEEEISRDGEKENGDWQLLHDIVYSRNSCSSKIKQAFSVAVKLDKKEDNL